MVPAPPAPAGLDSVTIASPATAARTLVLALATFSSVRSANRTARAGERSLLARAQPLRLQLRPSDPAEKIGFADGHWAQVTGGRASAEVGDGALYLSVPLHNVGPDAGGPRGGASLGPSRVSRDGRPG